MSNNQKLVRYCLTPEGEIPDYILTDIYGGMCSLWGIETNNRPWPQNLEVIGVTKKNIVVEEFDTILEVFDTSDKLFTYMSTFLSGQSKTVSENVETTQEDPENPGEMITVIDVIEKKVPVNLQEEVDLIWNKYLEINA